MHTFTNQDLFGSALHGVIPTGWIDARYYAINTYTKHIENLYIYIYIYIYVYRYYLITNIHITTATSVKSQIIKKTSSPQKPSPT